MSVAVEPSRVRVRVRVRVTGVVQGVGYRPFVHRVATGLGLVGLVGNDVAGVFVEAEGAADAVSSLVRALRDDAPPLAQVESVAVEDVPVVGDRGFVVVESRVAAADGPVALVPPDTAVCPDCLRETLDPADRRHRYPFTACTYCGPRFTIVRGVPYDRPFTTMAGFPLCPACQTEYDDPADRRFHAQPTACPVCGPRLRFRRAPVSGSLDGITPPGPDTGTGVGDAAVVGDEALAAALDVLAAGRIVAVKGVGGYHLACDARDATAVARLRDRKRRVAKPFAVLVRDLDVARSLVVLDAEAAALLTSPPAPIVVAPVRDEPAARALAASVAPGNGSLGVLLPYSPLHHLLLAPHPLRPRTAPPDVLVLTSANLSDEPICTDPDEAEQRLADVADAYLHHDRPIHVACDDSVVRVVDAGPQPVRRSRGYAPLPVRLPLEAPPTLAVGGELKATVCVADGRRAWLSQHLGDVASLETLGLLDRTVDVLTALARVTPEHVVADLHPGYLSHRWARERASATGAELHLVQHHHAHAASLLAEHGMATDEPVLVFAFDGTGYGTDGAIWGGELLLGGYAAVDRVGHLAPVRLPGGDGAIRRPPRQALAHLAAAGVEPDPALPAVAALDPTERSVVGRMLQTGTGCVPTTSMGRLFDAVASLVGVCQDAGYEGQAAIELEALAATADAGERRYAFDLVDAGDDRVPRLVLDPAPVLRAVVADLLTGAPAAPLAAAFHAAVADAVARSAVLLRDRLGPAAVPTVGLTGGVFQNSLLTAACRSSLERAGLTVLVHRTVPPNDGGLALGQAAVAASLAASR